VAGADLVSENSTVGWLAEKPSEHRPKARANESAKQVELLHDFSRAYIKVELLLDR